MAKKSKLIDKKIEWSMQPRQIEFLRACGLAYPFDGSGRPFAPKARVILMGGSAGGGKSDALLMCSLVAAMTWPGCNIGFFRREYPHLEGPGGAIMRSHELFEGIAKWHGGNRRWTFKHKEGNSVIQFCHCKNEEDVYSYQSQQMDILLIDESTQFTEFQLRYLLTRNRATVDGIIPFCAMATNPGGASHVYHKTYFVDAGVPGEPVDVEVQKGLYEKHLFIPARLGDNVVLETRDPNYRLTLERMPDEIRRALLDGDWNIFSGQYFKEFRKDKHVIKPFEIPAHWRRFGSIDWGFAVPCAVHFHAIDPSMGRVYTYKELYIVETRAGDVAKLVQGLRGNGRDGNGVELPFDEIAYIKASPDMWHERGLGKDASPGEIIAEEFTKIGLNVERADNRRILGWTRMREYLSKAPDDEPWWQIFDTCTNLIRTLPELSFDKHKVEDVSDNCEDHAAESCLVGDTLIDTVDGQIPIRDMVGKEHIVYCYDEQREIATTARCYGVRLTRQNAVVYEIVLEDGRSIKVTGDHRVLTEGGWKQVKYLGLGEQVVDLRGIAVVQKIHGSANQDVYNMEVENYHNFSLCGGLVFHNCRYALMSRPSPNEGSSFMPGLAEHYRNSTDSSEEDDDDGMPQEVAGWYGL